VIQCCMFLIEPNSVWPVDLPIIDWLSTSSTSSSVNKIANPCVDNEFTVGIPDDLKGTSTATNRNEIDLTGDHVSVSGRTVASRTQKSKHLSIEQSSSAAFESIAVTPVSSKEQAREAKRQKHLGK
jgi:hypothetical protein